MKVELHIDKPIDTVEHCINAITGSTNFSVYSNSTNNLLWIGTKDSLKESIAKLPVISINTKRDDCVMLLVDD